MVAAYEPAIRHAERYCERGQGPFVDGLARLEPLNRARQDTGGCGELIDAVSARDAKAEGQRR